RRASPAEITGNPQVSHSRLPTGVRSVHCDDRPARPGGVETKETHVPAPLTPGNHHRGVDPRSSSPAARFTRRRAIGIIGLLGMTGVLAACGSEPGEAAATGSSTVALASGSVD